MEFYAAIRSDNGTTFAVVVVPRLMAEDPRASQPAIEQFSALLGVPVILMAHEGLPSALYVGQRQLAESVAADPPRSYEWRQYRVQAPEESGKKRSRG